MNKAVAIILGLTISLLTGLLLFSLNFFSFSNKKETIKPVESSPTPVEEKVKWDDQSGFTFDYPKSIILNPHEEDKDNYAHLELTSSSHPGSIIVWTRDTSAVTLEGLLKEKKVTNAIDSTLGGEPAKKYITGDEEKTVSVSSLKNGYLYEIDTLLKDEKYWNSIADDLISSFKFKPAAENTASDDGTGGGESGEDYGGSDEMIE